MQTTLPWKFPLSLCCFFSTTHKLFFFQELIYFNNLKIDVRCIPVLGGSHFLWETTGSSSLMMLWEPDKFFNIYIFFGVVRTRQVVKKNSKLTSSQISQFSYIQQQSVFTTWLLKFSLIKISFNN
jgi:hypothetical protein